MAIIYIKIAASVVTGFLSGMLAIYVFNRMPAEWLTEYGERVDPVLADPLVQRIKGFPWRWVFAAGFICLCLRLVFVTSDEWRGGEIALSDWMIPAQLAAAGLFSCWSMLIIGASDAKYMIIPDQFVILLALSTIGFLPFYESQLDPVIGFAIGGGFMLTVRLVSSAIYSGDALGFGDVKLMAAAGMALGVKGAIFTAAASSIAAGIAAGIGIGLGRYDRDESRPLGPYICASAAFYVFIIWPVLI